MIKNLTLSILMSLLFSLANAQTIVIVEPDELGTTDNLAEAIAEQEDPSSVIFELRRGGFYEFSSTVLYEGSRLYIRSESGEGDLPILASGVDESGDSFDNLFEIIGQGTNLIFENLYLTGENVDGSLTKNLIRISANDVKLEVRSCYVDRDAQAFFRYNNPGGSIFITNSILRNVGNNVGPNNGRIFDSRGNAMDTIYLENNTMYNLTHHLIGHRGGLGSTPIVQYIWYNHNTVYNCGQVPVNLARALEATVSNNLFINHNFFGNIREWDNIQQTLFRVDSLGIIDTLGTIGDESQRTISIRNNAYYRDPIFPEIITSNIDTVDQVDNPLFNSIAEGLIQAGIIDTSNIFEEAVTFQNVPNNIPEYLTSFIEHQGVADDQVLSFFAFESEEVENTLGVPSADVAFDFNYDINSKAFAAADGGNPLGDPRWSEGFTSVSVERISEIEQLSMYPNPVSDNLSIEIGLEKPGQILFQLFDLSGKEVFAHPSITHQAGETIKQFDITTLNNGIYLAKLTIVSNDGLIKTYSDLILKN